MRGQPRTPDGGGGERSPRRPVIVVVGDALLDVDIAGRAVRLSPEGPAPVVEDLAEQSRAGGAGLAAALAAGTAEVVLFTALGADPAGDQLQELLAARVHRVISARRARTVVKSRVIADGRTLVRLDTTDPQARITAAPELLAQLAAALRSADAVLVSDYGLGTAAHDGVREALLQVAGRIPVVWDPHPAGPAPIPGAVLACPNQAEAALLSGTPGTDLRSATAQAAALALRWQSRHIAVTRGSAGAVLGAAEGHAMVVPARPVSGDTCGAGDAFAAGAATALALRAEVPAAVAAGVEHAGRFLAAGGVATFQIRPADEDHVEPEAPDADSARAVIERTRASGGTVVMAGGCFDLLHAGHVAYLQAARSLGDCLVVAMNSDEGVRRIKGPDRPIVPQADRARLLLALRCVDAVEIFDEPTPAPVLRRLRPDIFAKGADYFGGTLPEAGVMADLAGSLVTLPALPGRSSTVLRERLAHQRTSPMEVSP